MFNALCLGQTVEHMEHLLVAPKCLQNKLAEMIDEQTALAKMGQPAYIGIKINSLTDKYLIEKLIEASKAGVKIEMIIRGISCLIAGVPGETENVSIRSIVGRFLEHTRIYIFGAHKDCKVYIASADWMTRNTRRRVEVAAPIYDNGIKQRILDMFDVMMTDNVKARYSSRTAPIPENRQANRWSIRRSISMRRHMRHWRRRMRRLLLKQIPLRKIDNLLAS